jgi:Ca2+-transporting ATPase
MNNPSPRNSQTTISCKGNRRPTVAPSNPASLVKIIRRLWSIIWHTLNKFIGIDGAQCASAFAFNAFFALFPLIVLFVTIASFIIDRDTAGRTVIAYVETYVPISGEMQRYIFDTMAGVIKAREQMGAAAFLILIWATLQGFTTLICAINRAWGYEAHNWWRLPLKSLLLLGITAGSVLLGMGVPVLLGFAEAWLFPGGAFHSWVYGFVGFLIPLTVVFTGLSLFYKSAPRRRTAFAEVWIAALCATFLLRTCASLFVIYLKDFATFNAVYGAFGGFMALLLWIYLSGCIFILGGCMCAIQAEISRSTAATATTGAVERPHIH